MLTDILWDWLGRGVGFTPFGAVPFETLKDLIVKTPLPFEKKPSTLLGVCYYAFNNNLHLWTELITSIQLYINFYVVLFFGQATLCCCWDRLHLPQCAVVFFLPLNDVIIYRYKSSSTMFVCHKYTEWRPSRQGCGGGWWRLIKLWPCVLFQNYHKGHDERLQIAQYHSCL